MTTTTPTLTFPHETLTPIIERPTGLSLQQLRKEIYANARAIYSPLGGGDNGHLALVMSPAAYLLRAGTAWVDPNHPGPQAAHAANASQAQIIAINRQYDTSIQQFHTFTSVRNALRSQLLEAINHTYIAALEDRTFGFDDVTPRQIMSHLRTTYGTLTIDDLETNRKKLSAPWNPDDPIEDLWTRIKHAQDYATGTTEEITDETAMRLTLRAIEATGVLASDTASWRKKPAADRTKPNFITHFTAANQERLRQLTAKTAGYHGAHQADETAPPPPAEPPAATANAATSPTNAQPPHIELPSGRKMYYCWSHGLGTNRAHTSAHCQNKKTGHKDDATADNMMGGCDTIMKPRPRRSS